MTQRPQVALIGLDASRNQELARLLVHAGVAPICFTPEMWTRWPMPDVKRIVWATALTDPELLDVLGPAPSRHNTLVIEEPHHVGRVAKRHARIAVWARDYWDLAEEVQVWLHGSVTLSRREPSVDAAAEATWHGQTGDFDRVPLRRQWAWLFLVVVVIGLSAAFVAWPSPRATPRVQLPTEPSVVSVAAPARAR